MSGGGARVSIPAGVRRTIQNIKEIAGNHSDEEIYAMLKECGMDPNETAQKLLLQDPFHEVKRKRDKRKESVREPADSRWRPGLQGRGGRGGRGNYPRSVPSDAAGGRNVTSGKDNGLNQGADKANTSSSSTIPDTENRSAISIPSSISGVANDPSNINHTMLSQGSNVSDVSGIAQWDKGSGAVATKPGTSRSVLKDVNHGFASGHPDLDQCSSDKTAAPVLEFYASVSDPVLVPSLDTHKACELEAIKQVTGIQSSIVETSTSRAASRDISGYKLSYVSGKGSSDISDVFIHGKIQIKPQGPGKSELSEKSHSKSSFSGAISSRPSSNYSNRSQHLSGSQKAPVPNKEWKPKTIQANAAQASEMTDTSDVLVVADAVAQLSPAACSVATEEPTVKLENKVNELKLTEKQHVIIPNHLQVPESERHGLSFGSFDASFELNMVVANGPARVEIDTPFFESPEIEETIEKPSLSIHAASSAAQEADSPDHHQSPEQVPDSYSTKEAGVSASKSDAAEYDQSKQQANVSPEGPQNLVIQSAPSYPSLGMAPQVLGSQFSPFENSEPQARDSSRLPNFLVHQPYDPSTSYYTPFYRPTADADGRISPFLASSALSRYNATIAVLPAQTGQTNQENTNSAVLSTVGSTPLATQAAGATQGSVAIPQQPVPVFRQPAGLHLSHYPPNYIPYNQYFSPFYVPPPTLHHFLSGAAFPQQPPTGSMYQTPGAATPATAVKYSIPQYKAGANIGNSAIVGLPTVYGTYSSTPAGYTSGPAASSGNSTANEDLGSSQFKENSVYVPGQQSEGSAVWIPAPGRDISALQASSFYSIPPQGQHMTFAPAQAGHGAFGGIYPPTPTVAASVHPLLQQSQTVAGAVEMLGPPAGVYQQPQRAQINWTNNY
ncbi:hypothetical protein MUK42_01212 [Musa troglodytarum]|uniref:GBF-interacting protein 1 N-terminal domain-containing protein n=1 Tax=Musa troglodytarum TaxID=320322 RepID=A0A9E7JT59_9LILI|nr:hypothetical protein MUK42_01212 [Musa troglodytarum]